MKNANVEKKIVDDGQEEPRSSIQVLDRAMALLRVLRAEGEPVPLKLLSEITKVNRSTACRILEALRVHGYVSRVATGLYRSPTESNFTYTPIHDVERGRRYLSNKNEKSQDLTPKEVSRVARNAGVKLPDLTDISRRGLDVITSAVETPDQFKAEHEPGKSGNEIDILSSPANSAPENTISFHDVDQLDQIDKETSGVDTANSETHDNLLMESKTTYVESPSLDTNDKTNEQDDLNNYADLHQLAMQYLDHTATVNQSSVDSVTSHDTTSDSTSVPIRQIHSLRLHESIWETLVRLRDAVDETASLAVFDATDVTYLACAGGVSIPNVEFAEGTKVPLHKSAAGMLLLGLRDRDAIRHYAATNMENVGGIELEALINETRRANKRQFGCFVENEGIGDASVATLIYLDGHPIAALGIHSPHHRMDKLRWPPILKAHAVLMEAAIRQNPSLWITESPAQAP